MTRARALLPYALASVAIVVASTVAMAASIGFSTHVTTSPSSASTASRSLSADTRLAYWRESTDGRWELWVSDLDGSRRWTLATERSIGVVSLTAWRPDGNAVAYVRERTGLVIAPLVGSPQLVPLSAELTADGRGIVGFTWSSDGARLALSMRDAGGASRVSDVWVVEVASGTWRRLTEMGDALAGPWIDDDELLIETSSGLVALVRLARQIEIRPVTGMTAVSPQIGRDGRLYVAGGGGGVGPQSGVLPYGHGGIWSMALDGTDVRRERGDQPSEFRLLGRWVDERFVVSRSGSAEVVGDPRLTLPWSAGTILTVEPLTEREVLAFTQNRVLRLDPRAITPTAGLYTPSPGLTVLLDRVYDASLWRPPAGAAPVRTSGAPREPTPLSAFVRGRLLWVVTGNDPPRQILSAGPEHWIGSPQWSPDGELLAVALNGGDPESSAVLVFARSGQVLHRVPGRGGRPTWSADGRSLAIDVWEGGRSHVHVHHLDAPAVAERIDGQAAAWTDLGLLVLADRRIDLYAGTERRMVIHSSTLAAHPRLAGVGPASSPLSIYGLTASRDGTYFAVDVWRCCAEQSQAVVVIRTSDASIVNVFPDEARRGFVPEWAPSGHVFARNAGPFRASNQEDLGRGSGIVAEIVDPLTGEVVATAPGEFAGWAGDGHTWYVARPEGLFAYDLAGGAGVFVSPYGVPFSIAPR